MAPAFDDFPDWNRVRDVWRRPWKDGWRWAPGWRSGNGTRPATGGRRQPLPSDVLVTIDNAASASSTVVEVRAPDRGPVIYQVATALTGCGLTITRALVNTLGPEVLDVFYVQTADGTPVDDPASQQQLVGAVTRALLADMPD